MKFSIIVPCYNAEKYLREALDSVRRQSYADWECVCTDDGSTDSTGAILDEYAASDRRFVVIHQKNGGEGAARNVAMSQMTGDWFLFLDADDILNDMLLARLSTTIELYPDYDLMIYKVQQFSNANGPVWPNGELMEKCVDCKKELPYSVLSMGVCGGAYRRAKFGDFRFSELKIGADLVFVSQCLACVYKVVAMDFYGLGYRQVPESMSHRIRTPEMVMDTIIFREMVIANLLRCRKTIPRGYFRSSINRMIEGIPVYFSDIKIDGCWRKVWDRWLHSLEILQQVDGLGGWHKMVLWVILTTKSHMLVRILCEFPYRLKLAGIHRH